MSCCRFWPCRPWVEWKARGRPRAVVVLFASGGAFTHNPHITNDQHPIAHCSPTLCLRVPPPILLLCAMAVDLVERKADVSSLDDPLEMGRHWVEINRMRKKMKKKVDTKASKGECAHARLRIRSSPPAPSIACLPSALSMPGFAFGICLAHPFSSHDMQLCVRVGCRVKPPRP